MKTFLYRASIVLLLLVAFCFGYLTHRQGWAPEGLRSRMRSVYTEAREARPQRRGEWLPMRNSVPAGDDTESFEALDAIGYLGATTPAPAARDVTRYEADLTYNGLNLYSSGHAVEAFLMDMKGTVLHTWRHDFDEVWPEYSPPEWYRGTGRDYWRRVYAYANGDLLGLHDGVGLVKLDRDSNLLWAYGGGAHHDLQVTPEGLIYVLTREEKVLPRIHAEKPVLEPSISVLDPDGNELRRVSLLECFENSPYAPLLARLPEWGDIFHTNTIEVFDGSHAARSPLFAKGLVLISVWSLDTIAIVDLDAQTVRWALSGMWHRQHEPTLLGNGNMLVFDNRGDGGQSQILEFDPFTQAIRWRYKGTAETPFHSDWCGAVARLPNGNTLITETNNGRAFEVTPENRIVWEFFNPHRVEEDGVTLISSLWEVIRLEPDFGAEWLER